MMWPHKLTPLKVVCGTPLLLSCRIIETLYVGSINSTERQWEGNVQSRISNPNEAVSLNGKLSVLIDSLPASLSSEYNTKGWRWKKAYIPTHQFLFISPKNKKSPAIFWRVSDVKYFSGQFLSKLKVLVYWQEEEELLLRPPYIPWEPKRNNSRGWMDYYRRRSTSEFEQETLLLWKYI